MTLVKKILLLFLAFFALFTVVFVYISDAIWQNGYLRLEHREVQLETKRAQLAMDGELSRLHTLVEDWGPWDDTYDFARTLNPSFVQKNLSEAALTNMKLSYVLVVAPDGRPLYEQAFDLSTNKYAAPGPGQAQAIAQLTPLSDAQEKGLSGLLRLPDGTPLLVTSHPILTSERGGPPRGTLWFARRADADYLQELSNLVQGDLFWSEPHLPVREESSDTVYARWEMPVLDAGEPLALGLTVPRAIVQFGQAQHRAFLLVSAALSALSFLLFLVLLNRLLLKRLRVVSAFFGELAEKPNLSRRLRLPDEKDELAQVARSVNRLLDRLEQSQTRIRVLFQSARRELANRKRAEKKLLQISRHDALTGLYNRLHFEAETARLVQLRQDLGLIICDVDGLKLINDSFGHAAGDRLLKSAAQLLKDQFAHRGILCRIGGDEFAVLVPRATPALLEAAAQALQQALAAHPPLEDGQLQLNISLGSCHLPGAELTLEAFYRSFTEADDAMYRQKLSHDQSNRSALVQSMMSLLEARDFVTEGHSQRLQELCGKLGRLAGLSSSRLNDLTLLAQFHDIGKISIPDHILFKPGPLTAEEWQQMRRHPEIGHRIARHIPDLSAIAPLILHHHERWDGQGYPLGLAGEAIPQEARILALVDAYDAMTNDRPYRQALSQAAALAEIKNNRGLMFDPALTDAFLTLLEQAGPTNAEPAPHVAAD